MQTIVKKLLAAAAAALVLSASLAQCRSTTHATAPAELGELRAMSALEAVILEPGPVTVETVVGADWTIPRSGVLNLGHPKAKAAGMIDELVPIEVYFHALRHPTRGLYIVDTGVERALRDDPDNAVVRGVVAKAAGVDRMVIRNDTATWLAKQPEPLAGVFLTHLHLDHVSGMRDVPAATPIYAGPNEVARSFENVFVQPVMNRALEGKGALREWRFAPDPEGVFAGVLDLFGDKSVWALHVPGHTPGSTAYLARTPSGPVLLVGDACHTAWGWEHDVEPGTFSHDKRGSVESLRRLRALVARFPQIDVRLGHQALPRDGSVKVAAPSTK